MHFEVPVFAGESQLAVVFPEGAETHDLRVDTATAFEGKIGCVIDLQGCRVTLIRKWGEGGS
jgi:hypothetical protein